GGRRAGRGVYRRGAAAGRHPRSGQEPYRCHLEFRRNSDMMKLSCQIVGKIADTFRGEASRRVRAPWKSETQGGSCGCEARWSTSCSTRSCRDRKSTRLNSSHVKISYAVFCLKKK